MATVPNIFAAKTTPKLSELDENFSSLGTMANQNASGVELTGSATIAASSTSPALHVTQTGSGDALLVEDETNPDSTPFVIDATGCVIAGDTIARSSGSGTSKLQVAQIGGTVCQGLRAYSADAAAAVLELAKSRQATVGHTIVQSGDDVAAIRFNGSDGTNFLSAAQIIVRLDGTPGVNDMPGKLIFGTTADGASTPSDRMTIDSRGNIGIGAVAVSSYSIYSAKNVTGATTAYGLVQGGTALADVTAIYGAFVSSMATQAASFTLANIHHFAANQGAIGAGSTVTSQIGFVVNSSLVGATNNYGFYGSIPSGTNRWNLYMSGTAANYFAGDVTANAAFNQTPTRSTVASGSTIVLTTATNHLLYDNAATAAALTVTLPSASLTNGQTITLATRSAITALTVNGGTIYGAPTALAAGGFASFIYSSVGTAWFRKG
jgi:hypothetical protein